MNTCTSNLRGPALTGDDKKPMTKGSQIRIRGWEKPFCVGFVGCRGFLLNPHCYGSGMAGLRSDFRGRGGKSVTGSEDSGFCKSGGGCFARGHTPWHSSVGRGVRGAGSLALSPAIIDTDKSHPPIIQGQYIDTEAGFPDRSFCQSASIRAKSHEITIYSQKKQ